MWVHHAPPVFYLFLVLSLCFDLVSLGVILLLELQVLWKQNQA